MRKRDPRYKAHLVQQAAVANARATSGASTPNGGTPRRKVPAETYVEQEWQKLDFRDMHDDLEWAAAEGDDPEEWECVACGKTFRSEAAWDSHERSKKHLREIERLRREMQDENEELGLDNEEVESESPRSPSPEEKSADTVEGSTGIASLETVGNEEGEESGENRRFRKVKQKKSTRTTRGVEPLTKTDKMARDLLQGGSDDETDIGATDQSATNGAPEPTKREKRRAKQAKKVAESKTTEVRQ